MVYIQNKYGQQIIFSGIFMLLTLFTVQAQHELPVALKTTSFKTVPVTDNKSDLSYYGAMSTDAWKSELHAAVVSDDKLYYLFSGNNGSSWESQLLKYPERVLNGAHIPENVVLKTDHRGTVHTFFYEFESSILTLWHYSLSKGAIGWGKKEVFQREMAKSESLSLDVDIDCSNRIYVAYNCGEDLTRFSFWDNREWQHSVIGFGDNTSQCAVVAGFDQNVHIAIANENGALAVATKTLQDKMWTLENVTEPVNAMCDLTLTPDGGLLVVSSPITSGLDKILQISVKKEGQDWHTSTLGPAPGYNLSRGSLKPVIVKTDPSGRIHLAFYFTDYSTPSRKSLAYLYSDSRGASWYTQVLQEDIYGYTGKSAPKVFWNNDFLFLAYQSNNGTPALARLGQQVNLKSFPSCLYRRNPIHENVEYVKDTASRIVDVPRPVRSLPKTPTSVKSRQTVNQGSFITRDTVVKLMLKDYEDVDGDTVSVYYNGQCILSHYGLSARLHSIRIPVDPASKQELILVAESEGSRPPCTVSVTLKDSVKEQRYIIKSNLHENGAITLNP